MKYLHKECTKCNRNTKHRFVPNKTNGYYACSVCREDSSKKYRQSNWLKYLSQKANSRKKPDSEKVTEKMLKDLYTRQNRCCALSGRAFDMKSSLYRPSLDRIDSEKGYTRDNIQLVLFVVNKMKRELKEAEFLELCYSIAEYKQLQLRPYLFLNGVCGI